MESFEPHPYSGSPSTAGRFPPLAWQSLTEPCRCLQDSRSLPETHFTQRPAGFSLFTGCLPLHRCHYFRRPKAIQTNPQTPVLRHGRPKRLKGGGKGCFGEVVLWEFSQWCEHSIATGQWSVPNWFVAPDQSPQVGNGPLNTRGSLAWPSSFGSHSPFGFLATACPFPFLHNVAPERSHQNPSWFSAFLQEHHHRKTNNNKNQLRFPQVAIRSISYSLLERAGKCCLRRLSADSNCLPGSNLTRELITRQLKPSCLSRLTSHFTITIPNNFTLNLNL